MMAGWKPALREHGHHAGRFSLGMMWGGGMLFRSVRGWRAHYHVGLLIFTALQFLPFARPFDIQEGDAH